MLRKFLHPKLLTKKKYWPQYSSFWSLKFWLITISWYIVIKKYVWLFFWPCQCSILTIWNRSFLWFKLPKKFILYIYINLIRFKNNINYKEKDEKLHITQVKVMRLLQWHSVHTTPIIIINSNKIDDQSWLYQLIWFNNFFFHLVKS